MKWSKPRNGHSYAPQEDDPYMYMNAYEREKHRLDKELNRPTLARTLTRRLSDVAFRTLFKNLPVEHARKVVDWKNYYADTKFEKGRQNILGFEPNCVVEGIDQVTTGEGSQKETCYVIFDVMYDYYGIRYDLNLTLHSDADEDTNNATLDGQHKSKEGNQSILTHSSPNWSKAHVKISLHSPDYSPNKRQNHIDNDQHNVESTADDILRNTQTVFSRTIIFNLDKGPVHTNAISTKDLPDPSSYYETNYETKNQTEESVVKSKEKNLESLSVANTNEMDIDPIVIMLCQEHGLDLEQCFEVQRRIIAHEMELNGEGESEQPNDSVADNSAYGSHVNEDEEDMDIDSLMLGADIATDLGESDQVSLEKKWKMSIKELENIRNDMLLLDDLVDRTNLMKIEEEKKKNNDERVDRLINEIDSYTHNRKSMQQEYIRNNEFEDSTGTFIDLEDWDYAQLDDMFEFDYDHDNFFDSEPQNLGEEL
eukprot:CAMPEP_0184858456 /NCGR_PEP_ID=MMETSP0580-20130426/3555_1 /TAXON_ID=1118495 /ORGANISM="Dactyliosolen fragilissimus" /LENGTH=480 /DNA_ID=CAMNT_0027354607 /DNA_START=291 /DNA_END=1733 /DNA_ORIENTATION=+